MYTLSGDYYRKCAVFRKNQFWVLPPGATTHIAGTQFEYDKTPAPRIFHTCPALVAHRGCDVGIVFLYSDINKMVCDRCHTRPDDDVLAVYTLLKEA